MSFQPKAELLKFGAKAPEFSLPGTDGKTHSLKEAAGKKAIVVIFACNHCPYVVAYEDRMIQICKDYQSKGVQFFVVNANDRKNYPEDSFEKMKIRAKEKNFPYPYLRDDDQSVATKFGAGCTPEVFLFNSNLQLAYHGRIDDNYENPDQVRAHYLRDAITSLLKGQSVSRKETHPIGCSIKWSA